MANVHHIGEKSPQNIEYHGSEIIITFRPDTKDYEYKATRNIVLRIKGHASSYEACLKDAQHRIDRLAGDNN